MNAALMNTPVPKIQNEPSADGVTIRFILKNFGAEGSTREGRVYGLKN
jgi:hypothetical protein